LLINYSIFSNKIIFKTELFISAKNQVDFNGGTSKITIALTIKFNAGKQAGKIGTRQFLPPVGLSRGNTLLSECN